MKKILYSPNAIEKLQKIKWNIRVKYGVQISNRIIKNILSAIKELRTYENKGVSVARMTGIPCEYRMIFAEHNYVFYKIEKTAILIIDIYNEKEDFMHHNDNVNGIRRVCTHRLRRIRQFIRH